MLELRLATFDHPDAQKLVAAVQLEYVSRYGGEDVAPIDPGEFTPPRGIFYVGYCNDRGDDGDDHGGDGEPVVSGGWRLRGEHTAEIKRMYVVPCARRRGYARTLLAELERSAASAGCTAVVLETGIAQPEAIALYASAGYRPVQPFGYYRCAPRSRFYGKALAPAG